MPQDMLTLIKETWMKQFARAAITKYHKVGGLSSRNSLSYSPGSQKAKIKVEQSHTPSEGAWKGFVQDFLLASDQSLACGHITLVFNCVLPAYMSVSKFPLSVRMSDMLDQSSTLLQGELILTNHIFNNPISKEGSHSQVLGIRVSTSLG